MGTISEKTVQARDDADTVEVISEIGEQIAALWDLGADDPASQSDKRIDLLAEHLLIDIPRAKPRMR